MTGLSTMPRASAAAAAPVDPVPELLVSPAPRSQKRTSMVWRSTASDERHIGAVGKPGIAFDGRAHGCASRNRNRRRAGRTADCPRRQSRHRGPARWRAVPRCAARPCSFRTRYSRPWCDEQPQMFDARAGADAEFRLRPVRSRASSAAAQRVPLPESSGSLPSELKRRMEASKSGAGRCDRPASSHRRRRPYSDRRWPRRFPGRPVAGRVLRHGEQEIVFRAVQFNERDFHG